MTDFAARRKAREDEIAETRKAIGEGKAPPLSHAERLRRRRELRETGGAGGTPPLILPGAPRPQPLTAGQRARMSLLADQPEERAVAFRQMFPQGSLEQEAIPTGGAPGEPGEKREIFRRSPTEPFGFVDPTLAEAGPTAGLKAAEIGRDVADLAGELPSLTLEAVQTLLSRGGNLALRALKVGTAGGAGELGRQAAQEVAGTQLEGLGEVGQRALFAMGAGAAGEGVGSGAVALRNLVSERGIMALPEDAVKTVRAFERLGIPPPAAFQVSRNPLMRGLGTQLSVTVPSVANLLDTQRKRLVARGSGVSDPKERSRLIERGADQLLEASNEIERQALKRPTRLGVGGSNINQGIRAYEDAARAENNTVFAWARELEEPQFNVAEVKGLAQELKVGNVVARETEEGIEGARVGGFDQAFDSLLDDILAMPDDLPSVPITLKDGTEQIITPTEQMRGLMRELHDFMVVGPTEIARQPQQNARQLFGALKQEMADAAQRSGDPEFIRRWNKANRTAARHFETRENLASIKSASEKNPTELMQRLAQPGTLDQIVLVRRALKDAGPEGQAKWAKVQDAFVSDLIDPRNPGTITARINRFDKETLNVFLAREGKGSVGEQVKQLKQTATALDELRSVDFISAQQHNQRVGDFIDRTVQADIPGQAEGLARLVKQAGGKDSPFGTSVRSGLADFIVRQSREVSEDGIETISAKKLNATLRLLGQRKLLRFMKPEEVRFFSDAKKVAQVVNVMSDVGASLQRQSIVAGLTRFSFTAISQLVRNVGIGRIMLSPPARALIGGGVKQRDERLVLKLAALAGTDLAVSSQDSTRLANSVSQLGEIGEGTPLTEEETRFLSGP